MDILIKNMEMPQEGHIEAYIWCNGTVTYRKKIDNQWDRNSTTAVALPEHGDLIDRGLVQEVLAQLLPLVITNELTDKEIGLVHRTVGAIAEMINEQEVVVEATE